MTYDHLFNEFLFELLGLCHDCHERITAEKRARWGITDEDSDDDHGEPEAEDIS
ncbi:hypothetical protein [Alteriqipengyuania sp. 357]